MQLTTPLRGNRLSLQAHRPGDEAGPYLAWMNDADVLRGLEAPVRAYAAAELGEFIAAMRRSRKDLFLAMVLADGSHAGNIKLSVTPEHRRGSTGLIVDPAQWGKGLGTEAIALLTEHAFANLGLIKVTAGCYGSNPGSARAFIKAGFSVEAVRPMHQLDRGQWVDCILLGRLHPRPAEVPTEPWR